MVSMVVVYHIFFSVSDPEFATEWSRIW